MSTRSSRDTSKSPIATTSVKQVASWAVPGALLRALLEPDLDASLTPAAILGCDNHEFFSLLPLLLNAIQRIGETPGSRRTVVALVNALRTRVSVCRASKLRLVLLLSHNAGYAAFWTVLLEHRPNTYAPARAFLLASLHALRSEESQGSSVTSASFSPSDPPTSRTTFQSDPGAPHAAWSAPVALDSFTRSTGAGSFSGDSLETTECGTGIASADNTTPVRERSSSVSRRLSQTLHRDDALCCYAVTGLLHPDRGVALQDRTRGLRVLRNSFRGVALVDLIVERGNLSNRADAVVVGQRLLDLGLIRPAGRQDRAFEDSQRLFQSVVAREQRDAEGACRLSRVLRQAVRERDDTTGQPCVADKELVSGVELKISVDMVDLQSIDFWTRDVFLQHPTEGQRYGYRAVTHPMLVSDFSAATVFDAGTPERKYAAHTASAAPNVVTAALQTVRHVVANQTASRSLSMTSSMTSEHGSTPPTTVSSYDGSQCGAMPDTCMFADAAVVTGASVKKVFSSIARPMIIELCRFQDDAAVSVSAKHDVVQPRLLVKEGDNLGQDMCVEVMFQCFNAVWADAGDLFSGPNSVPFAQTYEVFPTGSRKGFMEALHGLQALKSFDWAQWRQAHRGDGAARRRMAVSAAGSYVACYVLGAADRHMDNVQIQDDLTMLHIDFGYLLGSKPPIDGPRFAIYPSMVAAFRDSGVWSLFVETCEKAFVALRRAAPTLIRTAVLLFDKFGFPSNSVREFMTGKYSLNTHEKSEETAASLVRHQVVHSSSELKTWFKSYSHETIDPAFYSLLERRFPPAVLAMKIVEAGQRKASKQLEQVATSRPTRRMSRRRLSPSSSTESGALSSSVVV